MAKFITYNQIPPVRHSAAYIRLDWESWDQQVYLAYIRAQRTSPLKAHPVVPDIAQSRLKLDCIVYTLFFLCCSKQIND